MKKSTRISQAKPTLFDTPHQDDAPEREAPEPGSTKRSQAPSQMPSGGAGEPIPGRPTVSLPTLSLLREDAAHCRACPLWERATQTVFGEGPTSAELMLVGEQPGDVEDQTGHPFVGPAGRLLDEALERAGIDRTSLYVTNVVKHFKWEPRGKRRIHSKPVAREIAACRRWLDEEVALLRPRGLLCLGATAAQALIGSDFRVTAQRGELVPSKLAPRVMATVHPSSLLRMPDEEQRKAGFERFVEDLGRMKAALWG